jgi:hypothetical protein
MGISSCDDKTEISQVSEFLVFHNWNIKLRFVVFYCITIFERTQLRTKRTWNPLQKWSCIVGLQLPWKPDGFEAATRTKRFFVLPVESEVLKAPATFCKKLRLRCATVLKCVKYWGWIYNWIGWTRIDHNYRTNSYGAIAKSRLYISLRQALCLLSLTWMLNCSWPSPAESHRNHNRMLMCNCFGRFQNGFLLSCLNLLVT